VNRRTRFAITASAVGLLGLAAAVSPILTGALTPAHAAGTFNVKDYGATGNGSTNDAAAITKAVNAANSAGGGTVEFPSGTYKVGSTVHLKSNVTVQLDSGSTLTGTSSGYDAPESNPNDSYQDFGHSHFHDAMFYGDGLSNIGFTGSGTIDGGGNFITGNPSSGQADKLISLTRCSNLTMNGITLKRGGHFAILINGCDGVSSDHLNIQTASDRDGWNVINTQHATFTNITVAANDDALVFKSDWALGQRFPQGHVTVTTANLSAQCCNALMFGSETCSDFTDYNFSHITITKTGKSGLGVVSMDGANISDVHYSDVTMSGTASPIMMKIGTRKRCGDSPGVGSISSVTFDGVTGSNAGSYSPTIWGQSGHQVSDVTFTNVNLTLPGGHAAVSDGVPSDNGDYNPNSIGTRPAYGWYIHQANNIHFASSSVKFSASDARPAVIANTGSAITFDGFTAQKGTASYDMGFQSVTGYCVSNSANTSGGSLRISTTSSTQSCGGGGGGGLSVTGLSVADSANAADWSVQSNLQVGNTLYGDRTFTVASLPSALAGAAWIRTANDSKSFTGNPLATFTINQSATVYIGVDGREGKRPFMDSSWSDTGLTFTDTEGGSTRTFHVYGKTFAAGTVQLGPDADTTNSASMYTIALK
jgi:polygalacturonase